MKIKKRLTENQEFELLKIVFDKFLLVSVLLIVSGLTLLAIPSISRAFPITLFSGGLILLVLFVYLIIAHYEVIWR